MTRIVFRIKWVKKSVVKFYDFIQNFYYRNIEDTISMTNQ